LDRQSTDLVGLTRYVLPPLHSQTVCHALNAARSAGYPATSRGFDHTWPFALTYLARKRVGSVISLCRTKYRPVNDLLALIQVATAGDDWKQIASRRIGFEHRFESLIKDSRIHAVRLQKRSYQRNLNPKWESEVMRLDWITNKLSMTVKTPPRENTSSRRVVYTVLTGGGSGTV